MTRPQKKVLAAGNCDFDHKKLVKLLQSFSQSDADSITVQRATTATEVFDLLRGQNFDLVLLNRVFDRDQAEAIKIIPEIVRMYPQTPVILISNFAEARQQAEAEGGRPGFGKADFHSGKALAVLRPYLDA